VSLAQPGKTTALVSGAPLFWSWSPRGDRIAAHVGGGRSAAGSRVVILDATSGEILRQVSDSPGDFRVPAWSPCEDLLAYVEQKEEDNILYLLDVASNERAPVATAPGITTALWSTDGRFLAFGGASRAGSVMLSWIKVLDLESGRIQLLVDEPVAGFFWSPRGDALLYVSVDAQRSHLCWHRANRETGESAELVRFLPSREQTLIFSFFDQYAGSHPPVAPDGSTLAFVGYLMGKGPLETTASAQVYLLPLDPGGGTATPVGTGQFACWNPS
jgi:Tol biopolymer transport system component